MNVLVFSPVPLALELNTLRTDAAGGGGWVGSLLNAMRKQDPGSNFCVICRGEGCYDRRAERVRCVMSDERHFASTVVRLREEFKPDVIHINGTEFSYGAFDESIYGGVPVVVSLQGVLNGCYSHYSGGLTPSELWGTNFTLRHFLKGWSIFGEQKKWRIERSAVERKTLQQHRFFVGRTEWDRAWVSYFNPRARYFSANETLRDVFYKVRRDATQVNRHAIFCGGAASYPLKGAHWLLRAIASLRVDYPDVQLRIANCDHRLGRKRSLMDKIKDDAYAIYLRRLIEQLGIDSSIVALPALSAEGVAKELQMAEIFVLPSLCENSPNSLGEAMLIGTPSIATYVGGTPSILKDGIEGKLVPSADPAALAFAIRRWFEHPDEAEACVGPARETALARHDPERNASVMLAIYKEVLYAQT